MPQFHCCQPRGFLEIPLGQHTEARFVQTIDGVRTCAFNIESLNYLPSSIITGVAPWILQYDCHHNDDQ